MQLSSQCFVFSDGREFCSNDEDELKFYINDQKKGTLSEYVDIVFYLTITRSQ